MQNVQRRQRAPRAARALLLGVVLAGLSVPATGAHAAPSIGELVAACERGLAQGNKGVDAALCEWYAVPCDCKLTRPVADQIGGARHGRPHWCLPATESIDAAMLAVLGELRRQPDRGLPADRVVPDILARLYPCPE